MKKRGYVIGASAIAAGLLTIILMFFTFITRDTSTVASHRMVYYNSFDMMNFKGVWSIVTVSIIQIILIVFAVATIVVGVLKVCEVALDKEYDLDEVVAIALAILAFVGICVIFFAVLYCKFSNKIADTESYTIRYKVFVAPFMQVALTIAAYAISSIMSSKNNQELLESLGEDPLTLTADEEGEIIVEHEGEGINQDNSEESKDNIEENKNNDKIE